MLYRTPTIVELEEENIETPAFKEETLDFDIAAAKVSIRGRNFTHVV